ncbi:MAG: winged helix-turn-helix transcriptional regulator [Nitrososphaerota archaeon]|nr:winged helix-turn-helix transcriptional regulator [Nitrososphaerota archaeon]
MPEPGERKLELLALLANGPRGYTELREKLKITDPALQRHLNDLQAQGIVGKAEDGRWSLKLEGTTPEAAATSSASVEAAEAADMSLYAPSARLRWFAYQDLNPLISPGAIGAAKFAAATLLTLDVYPLVKMAKELKARFTKGKESGDEYLYASWLQRLIVDSVSFDEGFLAAVKKRGVAAQRRQLVSTWSIAEGFVNADLGFDYGKAYEASRRFIEGKGFRERILKQWTFESELKEAGYHGELTEGQFLKLWGWTRIKVYVLGEWKARRVWKELLSAGLKGLPTPHQGSR